MTREFKSFQVGSYVKVETPRFPVWRILKENGRGYDTYNPASAKTEFFYKEDLTPILMQDTYPNLLNWETGEVIRENRNFIAGNYTINKVKLELSCEKGTDNYQVTDGIETLTFSHLHELQNFVKLKAGVELRFSSDLAPDDQQQEP